MPQASERTSEGTGSMHTCKEDLNHNSSEDDNSIEMHRILALRPTQIAVGMQQVRAKAQKITAEHMDGHSRTLNKFLLRHPLPAIKGPNESLFIIDKHHLSLALHQLGVEQVTTTCRNVFQKTYVQVVHDWSRTENEQDFWEKMIQANYLWLHDEMGKRLNWAQVIRDLPSDVTGLKDDPFRSLAALVRKSGGYSKVWVPFTEFQWANYLRSLLPHAHTDPANPQVVADAVKIAQQPQASSLPGHVSLQPPSE